MPHSSRISCLHRLRHCFVIRGERQENSLGHMTVVSRSYGRIWRSLVIGDHTMSTLERFVVLLYDRTSDITMINDCRKQLFTRKSRILENLPPTKAALQQHVERATYQAICWPQALTTEPKLTSPEKWGWKKDSVSGWQPFWTTLPEASQSCYELIRCGCLKGCCGRCKCKRSRAEMHCSLWL